MRTKGYKCSNVNCGSCVGHSLCGEPADTALGCASRMVNMVTNADRIRAMSDEELAKWFGGNDLCGHIQDNTKFCESRDSCTDCIIEWLKQPAED